MAERALQRAAIFGRTEPLGEDAGRLNGVLPGVVFVDNIPLWVDRHISQIVADVCRIEYDANEFHGIFDPPDPDEPSARVLWTYDLHMESEEDV